jgi:hypothetical protein
MQLKVQVLRKRRFSRLAIIIQKWWQKVKVFEQNKA